MGDDSTSIIMIKYEWQVTNIDNTDLSENSNTKFRA